MEFWVTFWSYVITCYLICFNTVRTYWLCIHSHYIYRPWKNWCLKLFQKISGSTENSVLMMLKVFSLIVFMLWKDEKIFWLLFRLTKNFCIQLKIEIWLSRQMCRPTNVLLVCLTQQLLSIGLLLFSTKTSVHIINLTTLWMWHAAMTKEIKGLQTQCAPVDICFSN